MPSLLGQVQNCCSSSPVTQNEHSVHIGGSGGSIFHSPNPHCETRLRVSSQTPMPDGPDWLVCTPECCCIVVPEDLHKSIPVHTLWRDQWDCHHYLLVY